MEAVIKVLRERWLELLVPERHIDRFTVLLRELQATSSRKAIVFREKARGRTGDRVWMNGEAVRLATRIAKTVAPSWRRDWAVCETHLLPPKATLEHLMGNWGRDLG